MPWNEPGGNQQDPWTGKKRSGSGNDPEEMLRQLNQKLGQLFGGSGGGDGSNHNSAKGLIVLLLLLVLGWLATGFYTVDARQAALVLRFGAYTTTTDPGLHWHFPYPIETVEIVDVEQNRSAQDRSTMLTKDENIVEIAVSAQYKVRDPKDYAFNIVNPDNLTDQTVGTLYQVLRGATREVIGRNNMDFILREGREQIAADVQRLMQQVLDAYGSGLQVITVNLTYAEAPPEVKAAFDDANKAREDANRFQNEAETYANRILPEARGEAARVKAQAEAYLQETVAKAQGEAARFTQLVAEYNKAPEVTRERLYLEAMENVMAGSRKVVVNTTSSNNMLYLPLDQLTGAATTTPTNTSTAPAAAGMAAQQRSNATSNGASSPATPDANATASPAVNTGRNLGTREGR